MMARDVVERLRADLHFAGKAPVIVNNKALSDLLAVVEAAKEYVTPCDGWKATEAEQKLKDALARLYAGSSGES